MDELFDKDLIHIPCEYTCSRHLNYFIRQTFKYMDNLQKKKVFLEKFGLNIECIRNHKSKLIANEDVLVDIILYMKRYRKKYTELDQLEICTILHPYFIEIYSDMITDTENEISKMYLHKLWFELYLDEKNKSI